MPMKTRGRGRKKGNGITHNGDDPRKGRHRKADGNNRSNKLKSGEYFRPRGRQMVLIEPARMH